VRETQGILLHMTLSWFLEDVYGFGGPAVCMKDLAFRILLVTCQAGFVFLASEYVSKQVRVVPSINRPTRVSPSVF
jgi:hypothetical protein